jgi:hypothetical protein
MARNAFPELATQLHSARHLNLNGPEQGIRFRSAHGILIVTRTNKPHKTRIKDVVEAIRIDRP